MEEQFYLVFPLLILVTYRLAARRAPSRRVVRQVAGAVGGVMVLSFFMSVWLTYSSSAPWGTLGHNRSFAFYASPTRAWEFAIGALLALVERRLAQLPCGLYLPAGVVGLGLVVVVGAQLNEETPFPGYAAIVPVASAALLVVSGIRRTESRRQAPLDPTPHLDRRPVLWVVPLALAGNRLHRSAVARCRPLGPFGCGSCLPPARLALLPSPREPLSP